jgi:hypothetical protein
VAPEDSTVDGEDLGFLFDAAEDNEAYGGAFAAFLFPLLLELEDMGSWL